MGKIDDFVKDGPFKSTTGAPKEEDFCPPTGTSDAICISLDISNEMENLRVQNAELKSALYWGIEFLESWHKGKGWVSIFVRDLKARAGLK